MALYALGKDEGQAVWFLDTLTFVKATARQTGNGFGLIEQLAAVGQATPYHVHHAEDETFYVLQGELEFFSERRRFTGGSGAYVFLPRQRRCGRCGPTARRWCG